MVSGRSGSGKSTLLRMLEDCGYNCVDNLPVPLLSEFVSKYRTDDEQARLAVSIDARNRAEDLGLLPDVLESLNSAILSRTVVFLDALNPALAKRFGDTRRKHPLVDSTTDLLQALDMETRLLAGISELADLRIDTTQLSSNDLRVYAQEEFARPSDAGLVLILRSFGYKHGVPVDADFVFDVRCLPNPYWEESLRSLTGLCEPVRAFFQKDESVDRLRTHICNYLETWLPTFQSRGRIYVSVALGCTGGRHRSVYLIERVAERLRQRYPGLLVRHREM